MKLITPSKVPFLIIAGFLDLTSLFFPVFDFIVPGGGTFLSYVWDFVGFLIFSILVIVNSGMRRSEKIKIFGDFGKVILAVLGESLPWIGDVCPSWIALVLSIEMGTSEEKNE